VWKPNVPCQRPGLKEFLNWYEEVTDADGDGYGALAVLWTLWYDRCATACAHFDGCKEGANCQFGRRVERRTVLVGPVLDVWGELDDLTKDGNGGKTALKVLRVNVAAKGEGGEGEGASGRRLLGLEVPEPMVARVERHLKGKAPGAVRPALGEPTRPATAHVRAAVTCWRRAGGSPP
jgi:hypothetical protein